MNNKDKIDKLIGHLKDLKQEGFVDDYDEEAIVQDVLYWLGVSLRKEYEFGEGFKKFIEDQIEQLPCLSDHEVRNKVANKDW